MVAVRRLLDALPSAEIVDLVQLEIGPFDYEDPNRGDGFEALVDALLAHQAVVFASPVYWYAMSGHMKIAFDRLTDLLLTPEGRARGRALAGRDVWVLATGNDETAPECFTEPFRLTALYFDMRYRGCCYLRCGKDAAPAEAELRRVEELAAAVSAA